MATKLATPDAGSKAINSNFSLLGAAEALLPPAAMKTHAAMCDESLGLAAHFLQDQADCVRKPAACRRAGEALRYPVEFARQAWTRSGSEGARIVESPRTSISFTTSVKQLALSTNPSARRTP